MINHKPIMTYQQKQQQQTNNVDNIIINNIPTTTSTTSNNPFLSATTKHRQQQKHINRNNTTTLERSMMIGIPLQSVTPESKSPQTNTAGNRPASEGMRVRYRRMEKRNYWAFFSVTVRTPRPIASNDTSSLSPTTLPL